MGRGRRVTVRVLAVLGLLTFSFLTVSVVLDAAGRVGRQQELEPAGSAVAQFGADHPGEAVHLGAGLLAVAVGASGLLALIVKPERAGSATQVAAAAVGWLVASFIVGNADNHGGQAGAVDPLFVVAALPPLAAALTATPWHAWRGGSVARARLLLLAGLGLPWLWYAVAQGLLQRNTWPPLADPHHQGHWFVSSALGFIVVLVAAGAALAGAGWRVAGVLAGAAAVVVAATSLVAADAGSALHPAWAAAALLWGTAVLAVTWRESRSEDPHPAGAPQEGQPFGAADQPR